MPFSPILVTLLISNRVRKSWLSMKEEEFVDNVEGMQWLGLEARFVEPLDLTEHREDMVERQWIECQKVGEVAQEMKRTGYVVESSLGSIGIFNKRSNTTLILVLTTRLV